MTNWKVAYKKLMLASLAFKYMNTPAVAAIFRDVWVRQKAVLAQMDGEAASGNIPPPIANPGNTGLHTWEALYELWTSQFLLGRELKIQRWYLDVVGRLLSLSAADQSLTAAQKIGVVNWVAAREVTGGTLDPCLFCFDAFRGHGIVGGFCSC